MYSIEHNIEAYPGYNEDQRFLEFEEIKNVINEKYGSDTTAFQVRTELEETYNKLFNILMMDFSDKVFDIIFVLMDTFNITESKAISYLDDDNKEKVKCFAKSHYNTFYYENIEKKHAKEQCEKKGIPYYEFEDIRDCFE